MEKLTAVVIGYGSRGKRYSDYALLKPEEFEIKAICEPVDEKREYGGKIHNIKKNMLFKDFRELEKLPRLSDVAIIATQDDMHFEPAMMLIEKGYNLLLEKPISPSPLECKKIYEAAEKKGVNVIVCHVLRFTPFWSKLKEIIDDGEVGEIMSIIHTEDVGHLHYAHSFVRGNWNNAKKSSPMILAKSCHDTDLLQWLIGKECHKVQSFGSLTHFTKENKPKGAPKRCYEGCPHGEECYYNSYKFYYENKHHWRDVIANTVNATDEEVLNALKTTDYGRCVYDCDNDVVDHQVVNMEFDGGCTVSFTMTPFNKGGRRMSIFGTKGEIQASMTDNKITLYSFSTRETTEYNLEKIGEGIESGHGGGDVGIMKDTFCFLKKGVKPKSICDVRTSYLSHLIAFAAEESRVTGKVVKIDDFIN